MKNSNNEWLQNRFNLKCKILNLHWRQRIIYLSNMCFFITHFVYMASIPTKWFISNKRKKSFKLLFQFNLICPIYYLINNSISCKSSLICFILFHFISTEVKPSGASIRHFGRCWTKFIAITRGITHCSFCGVPSSHKNSSPLDRSLKSPMLLRIFLQNTL